MSRSITARHVAVALLVAASTSVAVVTADVGAAPNGNSGENGNGKAAQPATVSQSALVQLAGDPVTTAKNVERGNGQRVNMQGTATKSYRAQLSAQRNELKQWLRRNAPAVRITGSFEVAVNAVSVELNGTDLATLRRAPMVVAAEYQVEYGMHEAVGVDPDLALINAVAAWGGQGAAGAGAGVKVGIVDSGIDADHPCFDDMGDGDGSNNYTNNKVIVAKVFNNKAANLGYDAKAVDSHGTHVAGTVACDYGTQAEVDGVTIPNTISGVAPAALLGNYNVFPGDVVNARSEDILNALEAAYADEMDIVNMSLGGPASGIQDLLTMAVNNLDRAGMVVAVSAGNEGPGFSTVGSPGSAARALTAGASSVPHQVVRSISNNLGESTPAVVGEFGEIPPTGLTGSIAVILDDDPNDTANAGGVDGLSTACDSVPAAAGPGLIAVVSRNVCDFTVKVRNVQNAGYVGAIVVNRVDGAFVMGHNGTEPKPTIPAVMIGNEGKSVVLGGATSVTLEAAVYVNPYVDPNVMADFSSQGPTDVDRRIKPDVVAPGVNVLSSIPGGGFAFFNGTSMASPHLAGAAAVVKSQNPDWTAEQIRSAIVNTADRDALSAFFPQPDDDPNLVGSGLLDLAAAVAAPVTLDRVSVSFGQVPSGAGKSGVAHVHVLEEALGVDVASASIDAAVGGAEFDADVDGDTIVVTMSTPKQATAGPSWATVVLHDGSGAPLAHFRVYALIA